MTRDYLDPPPAPPGYFNHFKASAKTQPSETADHNPAASWLDGQTRANNYDARSLAEQMHAAIWRTFWTRSLPATLLLCVVQCLLLYWAIG